MKIVNIELDYEPESYNENFNVATFRKTEYTFFGLFFLTFKKIKVKNMKRLIYLQIEVFISRYRHIDDDPP